MKLIVVALLLAVIGCDDKADQRAARRAEQDKVLREARETLAEGQALVAAHDKAEQTMKELEEDGVIAVAVLFANCDVRDADEAIVANRARLKPFLARLAKLDRKSSKCQKEDRELADEILATVTR